MQAPRGTKDIWAHEFDHRNRLISQFINIFRKYGAQQLETPIFEEKKVLLAKYGQDAQKLIYNLENTGEKEYKSGDGLALRYDHTVPLVRFSLTHNKTTFRRYTIGKVYRHDNLSRKQIRLREFTQCDFDIVGEPNSEWTDEEVLSCLIDCMTETGINFTVRLNHRQHLLTGLEACGIEEHLIAPICAALDKLDKVSKNMVRAECLQKGLTEEVWARVDTFILTPVAIPKYLDHLKEHLEWDNSLVRGLDYYTGLIFEVVVRDNETSATVAAGGRYDTLFETMSGNPRKCIGFSIGLERILAFFPINSEPHLTIAIGVLRHEEPIIEWAKNVVRQLRQNDISAVIIPASRPNVQQQIKWALDNAHYFGVIGQNETDYSKIQVKNLANKMSESLSLELLIFKLKK